MKKDDVIGEQVINNREEIGEIIEWGESIRVDWGTRIGELDLINSFYCGVVRFVDEQLQQTLDQEKEAWFDAMENEKQSAKERKEREKIENKFGTNFNPQFLDYSEGYSYSDVENRHGIQIRYNGRGINVKNDEIIIISRTKEDDGRYLYHDRFDGNGDFLFSGEGSEGDQSLRGGNKAIIESETDNRPIHLYIELDTKYCYQGIYKLVDTKLIDAADKNHQIRKEFQFRLRKA